MCYYDSRHHFRSFYVPSRKLLWLIHIMFMTIVAIAAFVDTYTEMASDPEVVVNVQWMNTVATLDFRIPRYV